MYTFRQSTGELFLKDVLKGKGWAGQPPHKNDPNGQDIAKVGPLPRGKYKIGPAYHHPKLGPVTMNLTPDPTNEMFGRSDFRIHGFAVDDPNTPINETEYSSEGCIIQLRPVREAIAAGADRDLTVVE